jgi:short-subunit dehydrogenase
MKKIALVTGASAGIGKSTVRQLLQDGLVVYATARRLEKMKDIEEEGAIIKKMDVTDETSMTRLVNEIIRKEGRIDVLVNNAGYGSYGAIEDVSLDEARRQFDVNIFGLARLSQLVLPYMRNNKFGKIINISSMGGKVYTPMGGWYHATKHALEGFSDCLRIETSPFGVDVIVVEPGGIKSEWGDIAIEHMLETSGKGVYANMANKTAQSFKKSYKSASEPELIARTISRAIKAKRPKTRYVAGYMAKPSLCIRKLLPDRAFDWILKTQLN